MTTISCRKTESPIINVASVPQRSPFRFPGGKTWLVPQIRQWLKSLTFRPVEFIEPFAGGGIVSLTAAFENLADHIVMVELDSQIAAVWKTILNGNGEWLAQKIMDFELTGPAVDFILSQKKVSLKEKAFQTIIKNRINRGGILAPGAGRSKFGENGKGIKSRWYPQTLKQRILAIGQIRNNITFRQGDGFEVLREKAPLNDRAFFLDPPYTAGNKQAGKRLYSCYEINHEELFELAGKLKGDFLMTYDDDEYVLSLARQHNFATARIPMRNTHLNKMNELLIGRNLDWLSVKKGVQGELFASR